MPFHNRSADIGRFSSLPNTRFPRSVYHAEQTVKTTFDAGWIIPVYLDEILPGDSVSLRMTAFTRLATPIFPLMDNMHLDSFFFFVPMRLVWSNSRRFFGERSSPGVSDAFLIPVLESPAGGFTVGSLADYFGLPTVGQVTAGQTVAVSSLPFRAYNLIYNEWFRDQNITNAMGVEDSLNPDGPDTGRYLALAGLGHLLRRGKRHDYFTSALPWPERPISLDMTQGFSFNGGAPVSGLGAVNTASTGSPSNLWETGSGSLVAYTSGAKQLWDAVANNQVWMKLDSDGFPDVRVTINNLRYAEAAQVYFERLARGGSRYTEWVLAQFGVQSPDARLQRPEYLGGGSSPISVSPIAQTSATGLTGGSTALGKLGGVGTGVASGHGFSQSFTEHGYLFGFVSVRADLTYQQGLHRMWTRRNRFEFYTPSFANLGEQAIRRDEIYCTGVDSDDAAVFGYQQRWDEYRYKPNRITGLFKSTSAGNIDEWHLSQQFTAFPTLSDAFIQEDPPIDRVIAVPSEPHFLFDGLFSVDHARVMPTYSVPGIGVRF